MRIFISSALVVLVLTACDKEFSIRGTVTSSNGKPLTGCLVSLKSENRMGREATFDPPLLDESFITHPSESNKYITITCNGHKPFVLDADKTDGNLGEVSLAPRSGA
jgi:hypothetical protein